MKKFMKEMRELKEEIALSYQSGDNQRRDLDDDGFGDMDIPSIPSIPTMAKQASEASVAENQKLAWSVTADLLSQQIEMQQEKIEDVDALKETLAKTLEEKSKLEDELKEVERERDEHKHEKELLAQKLEDSGITDDTGVELPEYPGNETVLHNLLVAQIEFYFSNHHLKRDKPLMETLCNPPHVGYVYFDQVVQLPKVRTLGQPDEIVLRATKASKYLKVLETNDGGEKAILVGREKFQAPRAAEFPFRRTVFVYGIPLEHENEHWVRQNFECFGKIVKVKFDSGQHTLPRKVGARLLSKESSRVVRLHMRNQEHTEFIFRNDAINKDVKTYMCHECNKLKDCDGGYYVSAAMHNLSHRIDSGSIFCVQCAAKQAESNLKYFNSRPREQYGDPKQLEELLGIDMQLFDNRSLSSFRTCLIVFESQRQASKCVYVRSRLGIEGCFATHFHNYTRHKREVSQGVQPESKTPTSKQDSNDNAQNFRLQARGRDNRYPRNVGARIEGTGRQYNHSSLGLIPPRMSKNHSAPTLVGHRQGGFNSRFARPV